MRTKLLKSDTVFKSSLKRMMVGVAVAFAMILPFTSGGVAMPILTDHQTATDQVSAEESSVDLAETTEVATSAQVNPDLSALKQSSSNFIQSPNLFARADEMQLDGRFVEVAALASDDENDNDPLESMNRFFFAFNEVLLEYLFQPVSEVYTAIFPELFRVGVSNVVDNIATPVTVANSLLQGDPDRAMNALGRFMVNTIVGVGGLVDVAADTGVPSVTEDFGQTLAVWGVDEGFYLVLPFFGPSNPRDAVGELLVDGYFDPLGLWLDNTDQDNAIWARRGVSGLVEYTNVRDELQQIKKTSVDYYAAIRSLYRQKRRTEITNGNEIELPPIPELGYDLDPEDFNESIAGADRIERSTLAN